MAEAGMVPLAATELWDTLPAEDTREYRWFLLYRDMLPPRSLGRAYRARPEEDMRLSLGQWEATAKRNRWTARAYAYDRYVAMLKAHSLAADQATLARDHLALAKELRDAASAHLKEADPKATQAASQAADSAFKMARTELGLPLTVTRTEAQMRAAFDKCLAGQEALVSLVRERLCDNCFHAVAEALTEIIDASEQAAQEFGGA